MVPVVLTIALCIVVSLASAGCGSQTPPVSDTEPEQRRVVLRAGGLAVEATRFGGCEIKDLGGGQRKATCSAVALERVSTPDALRVDPGARLAVVIDPPTDKLEVRLYGQVSGAQAVRLRLRDAPRERLERAAGDVGVAGAAAIPRAQLIEQVADRLARRHGAEKEFTLRRIAALEAVGAARRWHVDLPQALAQRAKIELVPIDRSRSAKAFLAALKSTSRDVPPTTRPNDRPMRCPQRWPRQPPPERQLDSRTLVGLTEAEARDKAADYGCTIRIARRDGRELPLTRDLRPDRINVAIDAGTITRVVSID